ncbi:MAG: type IX secretion system membrane protein PorP/SprF [Chitinophagales bacterium]
MNRLQKTIICLLVSWLSCTSIVWAQQFPQLTQYMNNRLSYNPAYAGSKEDVNLEAAVRMQWVGIEGSPMTQVVGVHLPVAGIRSGIGLNIVNDLLGAERNTGLMLSYAYQAKLGARSKLSIGLSVGGIQKSLDGGKLRSSGGDYTGGVDHQDDLIPVGVASGIAPDAGFGLYLESDKLTLGLSAQHLLEPAIGFDTNSGGTYDISFNRHFFFFGSYEMEIGNIVLHPSLLLKSDLVKMQGEVSAIAAFGGIFKGGLAFRGLEPNSFDAVSILAGVDMSQQFALMYSYDFILSNLNNASSGSHELSVHYKFQHILPTRKGKAIYTPRFL